MDRLQAMRIFVKVADGESFAGAARQLHMSAAAVTRAIAALEETIGARLFVRTTRSVKLTEEGSRYREDCRRILADVAEAEASAAGSRAKPAGTLIVTAPTLFGRLYVLPIVMEYLDSYSAMTARTVFLDRPVNLVEEGIDVAVRIGHLADSGFTAVRVGSVRRVLCGSPDYFTRHGEPQEPADLRHHRIVASTAAWGSSEWNFGGRQRVVVHPVLETNTSETAIAAAVAGWGLTRVLHYQVAAAVEAGSLRIVMQDREEPALPIHLLLAEGRHAPAKVRAFVDLAAARLRANRFLN